MERFIYTRHALKRMRQRGVTPDHIRATVRYPDRKRPGKLPNTLKLWKEVDGKTCFVVVEFLKEQVIVITTGWKEGTP